MKIYIALLLIACFPAVLTAQSVKNTPQTQTWLHELRTAHQASVVFSAGANLVKFPPADSAEPALLDLLIQTKDPLKTTFAAVTLAAMGKTHESLVPVFQEVLKGKDPILRAYAAGGYALTAPQDTAYISDVVRLYILEPGLAQRAMNRLTRDDKKLFSFLKQTSSDEDPQLRAASAAWLGKLHTQSAVKQLLKMAKTETHSSVQTQLAMALANQADLALPGTLKGLQTDYRQIPSATYALALGFMTGNSVGALKTALADKRENTRINALRACAYMADILATPQAFAYSSDRVFDTQLLKSLIAPINALSQQGTQTEQPYARHALTQIEKLL